MKKIIQFIPFVFLISCSPHHPTQIEYNAHKDVEQSVTDCQKALTARETALVEMLRLLPEKDRTTTITMHLLQKDTSELVAAATGNYVDPCKQTNMFDSQIAEVREKTKQIKEGTGIVRTAVPWVTGALTVNALADKIGQGTIQNFSATDNGKINLDSQNSGSNNVVGRDYQNNGVNNNTNSDCKDCDKAEEGPEIEKVVCSIDVDCAEGQICFEGYCTDGATTDSIEPEFDLKACQDNPPFGLNSYGTPLYTNGCSCLSHSQGKC